MLFPIILIYILSPDTHAMLFILITFPSYVFLILPRRFFKGSICIHVSYLVLFTATIKAVCIMKLSMVELNYYGDGKTLPSAKETPEFRGSASLHLSSHLIVSYSFLIVDTQYEVLCLVFSNFSPQLQEELSMAHVEASSHLYGP